MLKNLNNYNKFQINEFIADHKGILFLNSEPNFLYVDGKKTETVQGSKIEVILRGSDTGQNEFEKLNVKFENVPVSEFENVKKMSVINLIGATGTLWGNGAFKNNLSIKATGFKVVPNDSQ